MTPRCSRGVDLLGYSSDGATATATSEEEKARGFVESAAQPSARVLKCLHMHLNHNYPGTMLAECYHWDFEKILVFFF